MTRYISLMSLIMIPFGVMAQEHQTVNLGRLRDTVVSASSVNGGRDISDKFYGVLNCFDGGKNIINKLNYSFWLSGEEAEHHQHWISARFPTDVTISEIWIITQALEEPPPLVLTEQSPKTTRTHQGGRPWECALDITYGRGETAVTKRLPSFWIPGFRHKVKMDVPLKRVSALKFIFPGGKGNIEIEELEILGPQQDGLRGLDEGPRLETVKTDKSGNDGSSRTSAVPRFKSE